MIIKTIARLLIPAIVLLMAGCGYYNPYVGHGYRHISLYRSMWSNHTTEIGLENTLFQAQSDWFRKSPLITLTDSAAEAEYELSGSIDRVYYPEISFGKFREGIEGRAELTVSFTIKDRQSGKIVWQREADSDQQNFAMVQDPIQLQNNKNVALKRIADDFAEEIYLFLVNQLMRPDPLPYNEEPKSLIPLGEESR